MKITGGLSTTILSDAMIRQGWRYGWAIGLKWLIVLTVVFLGLAALWWTTDAGQALTSETARRVKLANDPISLTPTSLIDGKGVYHDLMPSPGKLSLVEFFYSRCANICQSASADYARLRDLLVKAGLGDKVKMYSISFDPEHDRLVDIDSFGQRYGADGKVWTVVNSLDRPSLDRMLREMRVVVIPDGQDGFVHNIAVQIINDRGELVAVKDTWENEAIMASIPQFLPR